MLDFIPSWAARAVSGPDTEPETYFAVEFSDVLPLLAAQRISKDAGISAEEWQKPEQFHLTVMSVRKQMTADEAGALLAAIVMPIRFGLELTGLGTFGDSPCKPLVAFAVATPALLRLQTSIRVRAADLGLPVGDFQSDETYNPHVSLAYGAKLDGVDIPSVAPFGLTAERLVAYATDYKRIAEVRFYGRSGDLLIEAGGKGSGHFKHKGVPGQRGGSAPTYPEGMAPSDIERKQKKWRTVSDDFLSGKVRSFSARLKSQNRATTLHQTIIGTGRMSDIGQRLVHKFASIVGTLQNDAAMDILDAFRKDGLNAEKVGEVEFVKNYARALELASMNSSGLDDQQRIKVREVSQYLTALTEATTWAHKDYEYDSSVQEFLLHEALSTMSNFSPALWDRKGNPQTKGLSLFVEQALGGTQGALYRSLLDGVSEGITKVGEARKNEPDSAEVETEKWLVQREPVIDAAFSYAETKAEASRQSFLSEVSGAVAEMAKADKEYSDTSAERSSLLPLGLDAREAYLAGVRETDEWKKAYAAANNESVAYNDESRQEARRKLNELRNRAEEAANNLPEWKAYQDAADRSAVSADKLTALTIEANKKAREALLRMGYGKPETKISVAGKVGGTWMDKDKMSASVEKQAQAISFLEGMIAPEVMPSVTMGVKHGNTNRGYFTDVTNTATVSANASVDTRVHEAGHWLEKNNDSVHAQAVAFLRYRNAGEKYMKMSAANKRSMARRQELGLPPLGMATRGYKRSEVAAVDKWREPYCGKKYDGYRATEVVSMGLEYLYADPIRFAQEDPEHFNFTLAMLAGAK